MSSSTPSSSQPDRDYQSPALPATPSVAKAPAQSSVQATADADAQTRVIATAPPSSPLVATKPASPTETPDREEADPISFQRNAIQARLPDDARARAAARYGQDTTTT